MGLFNFTHKHCSHHHGLGSQWYLRRISKKLQLNATQQTRLSAVQNAIVTSKTFLAEIHRDRGTLLDDVFTDDGLDRQSALHYLNVPRLAFEEQIPGIVDSLDEFYQSLDPQQRQQLRSLLREQHQQRHRCGH